MSCPKPAASAGAGAGAASNGGSTSIVSTKAASGWHVVKVEGFSKTMGEFSVGMGVNYGRFNIGGHCWSILCYPRGFNENFADWVSFGLHLNRPAGATDEVDVKAGFRSSLLDKDGEPVSSYTISSSVKTFSSKMGSWIFYQFIKRKDLESTYITNDSFCIRYDVTVVEDICKERVVPQSDLHQHLGYLLSSEVGGDVTFEVGNEAFGAHKCLLAARSSVFKAQFVGGPMKDAFATRVRVDDTDARVFRSMLHFIYTDSLPDVDKGEKIVMAQHLLVAADRYNVGRLKLICEDMLCTFMNGFF